MTKIFVTGATGYIGGDALYAISTAHPEYEITALVRNTDKGAKVAAQYAKIRLVYGDLDSAELIAEEAKEADVVCHFAHADHEASINAIIKGLKAKERPGFLIHTSGTGILTFEDRREKTYGTMLRDKIYDDLENVAEVTSLPDDAPHRNVDKLVLNSGLKTTAIVCPPTIYGRGRGPDNQTSVQIPGLCRLALKKGGAVMINEGQCFWNQVHVHDLSDLYLKLVEEAAAGGSTKEWNDKPPTWGEEGYYFCENGEHVWGDVSKWVAEEGKKMGLWETTEIKSISAEEAQEMHSGGPVLWGTNSRGKAKRGRVLFGWEAKGVGMRETVAETLKDEAMKMGVWKGYAEVAAGNA